MATKHRESGSGSLFQNPDGSWTGRIELGIRDGKRIRKTVRSSTKTEALRKLRLVQAEVASGIDLGDNTTVKAWLSYWLEQIAPDRCRPATLSAYRGMLETHVYLKLGHLKLVDVKPQDLRGLYSGISGGATRLKVHRILSRAFKVAEREGKIRRNPCELMDSPSPNSTPHEVLSASEARQVLAAVESSRESARFMLALVLGLRQSEVLALDWKDIDVGKRVLSVSKSVQMVPGVGVVFSAPKSRASGRLVPLPQTVLDALEGLTDALAVQSPMRG
jgi:integrase